VNGARGIMPPQLPAALRALEHRLVVSCQALPGSAMDRTEIIVAMARAAVDGGAAALRIEGVANVRAVAAAVTVPIIGIVKRDLDDSPVRITPFASDVAELGAAGAQIIAFDATHRLRPASFEDLLHAVRKAGCIAMADCATEADGLRAWAAGCELIGTTLVGYTAETADLAGEEPDFDLVERLARAGCRVVAEGRLRTLAQAAEALRRGAFSVTVGSAITRIEHITEWFARAMAGAARR
jgi:N-acylglucosamine-6-phosphate 2-epimerase